MIEKDRVKLVAKFVDDWAGRGYEKGESHSFWIRLLSDVLGVENPTEFIKFEDRVVIDNTSFIDGYISSTKVLIEQKSLGKNLLAPIKQSDGSLLTPFQQAKRYSSELPYSERPRWIITCNFEEFLIYDMERPQGEPSSLLLKDLVKEYYRLSFITSTISESLKKEMEVSIKAGELVGLLYDELLKEYKDPTNIKSLESLNMFCVRIVFCLYAEDSGIFGRHGMFHDYLKSFDIKDTRKAIIDLFKILDQKEEDRDPYEDDVLLAFPYVNGGLFANENIEIPRLTETIINIILSNASEDFNWSEISPTIFGAVFESTLNPQTRRSGGMHYTSIENIHKVIDPLFLNDLKQELLELKSITALKTKKAKLTLFQDKLASLKFLDPACGSGNFLTETYLSLRNLENEVLSELLGNQIVIDTEDIIKVSINQFYGVEINDFAVTVGKTALWIAESQMMKQTEDIIHSTLDFLPLKSYAKIVEANALTLDWAEVVDKSELNYIIGNPPFLGYSLMSKEQKADLVACFDKGAKEVAKIDYVCGWYIKASKFIQNTNIRVAFVSTNSITQGEQPAILWTEMLKNTITINFAYRTFNWSSEASEKAAVHCVIIGFSTINIGDKLLFSDDSIKRVNNINPYLLDGDNILIISRRKPLYNVSNMILGSIPRDGGFLSNYTEEQMLDITSKYPESKKFFKALLGSEEFINNKKRYCIWLDGVPPNEYVKIPPIIDAIKGVKEMRLNSTREATRKLADVPYLFAEIRQPKTDYLIVPRVSSENRKYIPIGYATKDIIVNDAVQIIPNATLYEFGVLNSNVHMSWMRTVGGRLKSDYRYSATIVYNTFPWCEPTDKQKAKIEATAQSILDARAIYKDCSLAQLYNDLTMPPELRKAHQNNDCAVMEAYGLKVKGTSEADCIAHLMELYKKKVAELEEINLKSTKKKRG
ncbi:MAG: DNA methyltransferase [bacterium]